MEPDAIKYHHIIKPNPYINAQNSRRHLIQQVQYCSDSLLRPERTSAPASNGLGDDLPVISHHINLIVERCRISSSVICSASIGIMPFEAVIQKGPSSWLDNGRLIISSIECRDEDRAKEATGAEAEAVDFGGLGCVCWVWWEVVFVFLTGLFVCLFVSSISCIVLRFCWLVC